MSETENEALQFTCINTYVHLYLCTVMTRVIFQDGVVLQCAREGKITRDKN